MPYLRATLFLMIATALSISIGCGAKESSSPKIASTDSANGEGDAKDANNSAQKVADVPKDNFGLPDLSIPPLSEPSTEDSAANSAGKEVTSAEMPESEVIDGLSTDHSAGDVVELTPDKSKSPGDDDVVMSPEPEPSTEESIAPPPPIPTPAGSPALPSKKSPNATTKPSIGSSAIVRREGMTKDHKGFSNERVFFATNREPATGPEATKDPDLFFGDERGDLTYGTCEVSIPYRRTPGTLPEPSILKLEFTQDPAKHVVLMEIERLPDAEFWKALRATVEASPNRQLMLFVHGYCATFRDAARRTAQMAYDMNYQGPSMFFSWPAGSDAEGFSQRANYLKDLRRAEESDEDLIALIEQLGRLSGAKKIHVVAHSMGSFVLTEALKTLDDRMDQSTKRPLLFDQIAMAAPDLNAKEFVVTSGKRVRPFGRRLTVYASKHDKALKLSRTVNGFEPLGLLNDFSKQGAISSLYELVDASPAKAGWFDSGHVYYGDMPEMLLDLAHVFRGVPATSLQRGLGETPPLFRLATRSQDVQ